MVRKIVYWTSTVIVAVMLLFAFGNLTCHPQVVSGFTKAGYRTGSSRLADEHGIGVLFDLGCQHHSSRDRVTAHNDTNIFARLRLCTQSARKPFSS